MPYSPWSVIRVIPLWTGKRYTIPYAQVSYRHVLYHRIRPSVLVSDHKLVLPLVLVTRTPKVE